jgi:hypothetical protein
MTLNSEDIDFADATIFRSHVFPENVLFINALINSLPGKSSERVEHIAQIDVKLKDFCIDIVVTNSVCKVGEKNGEAILKLGVREFDQFLKSRDEWARLALEYVKGADKHCENALIAEDIEEFPDQPPARFGFPPLCANSWADLYCFFFSQANTNKSEDERKIFFEHLLKKRHVQTITFPIASDLALENGDIGKLDMLTISLVKRAPTNIKETSEGMALIQNHYAAIDSVFLPADNEFMESITNGIASANKLFEPLVAIFGNNKYDVCWSFKFGDEQAKSTTINGKSAGGAFGLWISRLLADEWKEITEKPLRVTKSKVHPE